MALNQPLPDLWLLSDARNDHVIEKSLRAFRVPIGFVFRHYFLPAAERRARYDTLAHIACAQGHMVILSGTARQARAWGADGVYGAPDRIGPRRAGLLHIATAHDLMEIGAANRAHADAVMLSPVFPTRSHPGAPTLGVMPFLMLAKRAHMPVIALGGMDRMFAQQLRWHRWAGVDGLSTGYPRPYY